MSDTVLRLGTRRSPLALAQSRWVAAELRARRPGLEIELVAIVTEGDRNLGDLSQFGGKGLFTAELEAGLADGSLDLAVHSLKDLPVRLPAGLGIAAHPRRADPRDVLVSEVASTVDELPDGAHVLTSSLRRGAQLRARRPDLRIAPVRGNVGTRLAKWREESRRGEAAATVLAAAGLARLEISDDAFHPIDPAVLVPAPGQGTLAVEVAVGGRGEAASRLLDDPATARVTTAERRIVTAFGADCTLPLGAWARYEPGAAGETLWLTAVLATADGRRVARAEVRGDDGAGNDPEAVAERCLAALAEAGADEVLAELRAAER